MSSWSFITLFIKTNSSWLITESIEVFEIKTFMLFSLDFANNTILSCFFFYFFIIDLYFIIPPATAHIFCSIEEIVIPIGIQIKEAKAEIETHSVVVEAIIRTCPI